MSLIRATEKLFAANMSRSVLGFVAILFFARTLGAAELGVFFLFQALLGLCAIPADFGISSATKKRISEGTDASAYLSAAAILKFSSISAVATVVLALQNPIDSYLGTSLGMYLVAGLFLQQYAQLAVDTLHGELRVGDTASIEVIEKITWIGVGVVLVLQGYGALALVYALLAGNAVKLLLAWWRKDTPVGTPQVTHVRSVFDYSKYSVISSIGGYAYSWVDILVIGFFLTSSHVGAYEVAWRVTGFVLLFGQSIGMTVFPQISEWSVTNAEKKISSLIPKATVASLLITVPAFFGTVVFSADILGLAFGTEYVIASTALVILMFDKISQSVHKIWGYSLQAVDRPDQAAVATVIALVANLCLNIVLIPQSGLAGAAAATALSFGINTGLHAYYLRQIVPFSMEYEKIGWCLVASIGMFSVMYWLQTVVIVHSLVILFGLVSAGVLIYFCFLVFYSPIRSDIRYIVTKSSE